MVKLIELTIEERQHWELHLNAAVKDTPSVEGIVDGFLAGRDLPNLKHPSDIHDWLENPNERVEKIDG